MASTAGPEPGFRGQTASSVPSGQKQADQLELLKVVHDAISVEDIRAALLPGGRLHEAVDAETSIDALCYIADNINEGVLRVSRDETSVLDYIVRTAAESLDVEVLRSTETAQLIWVMEIMERESPAMDASRSWRLQIVKRIAERQTKMSSTDSISAYSTRDLVNLCHSIGSTRLFASSAPVLRFLVLVLDELMLRLAKPHVRSAFSMRELGLVAAAVASAYEARPAESVGEARGAFEGFLSRLWSDCAKPKLANRHSNSSGGKSLTELNPFLFSYLRVFPDDPPDRMLEGIASYQTRLLKSELGSDTEASLACTFADLAAVLEFFAYYASQNTSAGGQWMPPITVVDLVSVTGACMRRLTLEDTDKGIQNKGEVEYGTNENNITAVASLLESHVRLNLRPAQETLLALVPYVRRQTRTLDPREGSLSSILQSFSLFGFEPGSAFLTL